LRGGIYNGRFKGNIVQNFRGRFGKIQADGFKSIMQSVEMAQAKNLIKDRAKEVETFQDTINRLMGYYLNSLEVNQSSEERIREELSKELSTKDNTISALYEQVQDLKADNETFKGNEKIKDTIINQADEEVKKLNKDIIDKQSRNVKNIRVWQSNPLQVDKII